MGEREFGGRVAVRFRVAGEVFLDLAGSLSGRTSAVAGARRRGGGGDLLEGIRG
ncbi:hypothetical protein [Saccharopolyspora gloriosae]|uniref:hypothetical protein n=1 Tax=Saccharopolyspora gloriosae TaxID=455344 RepID=UPI001FB7EECA|nr:hypothetical protein [Saccharopolyspora gloriosae]